MFFLNNFKKQEANVCLTFFPLLFSYFLFKHRERVMENRPGSDKRFAGINMNSRQIRNKELLDVFTIIQLDWDSNPISTPFIIAFPKI